MKIKALLSRFRLRTPAESKADLPKGFGRRTPLVRKSEMKALFHAVLEEKRDDLPSRRR